MGQNNMDRCALNTSGELVVSFNNTHKSIEVTNNKAKYYADLASQYKDESRESMEFAKYYAEQNSDVTMSNIRDLETRLLAKIEQKQDVGEYALKSEIPDNNAQLINGAGYITSNYHDETKQDIISDLSVIREGAAMGATALQSVPNEYITENELNEMLQYKMVDSYVNGASGYNIWQTPLGNYCEQWGRYFPNGASQNYTTTFIKPFINSNYNIKITVGRPDCSYVIVAYPTNLNAAYMNIVCGTQVVTIDWQVGGYIS